MRNTTDILGVESGPGGWAYHKRQMEAYSAQTHAYTFDVKGLTVSLPISRKKNNDRQLFSNSDLIFWEEKSRVARQQTSTKNKTNNVYEF